MTRDTSIPLFDPVELLAGDGPRARLADPVTSHLAADSTQSVKLASQRYVLAMLLDSGPLADHEILFWHAKRHETDIPDWSPSRLRTARRELVTKGLVDVVPNTTSLTDSGRHANVWRIVPLVPTERQDS